MISNKQRLAVEMAGMLLIAGAVVCTKSTPGQKALPTNNVQPVVKTQRLEIYGSDGKLRAIVGEIPHNSFPNAKNDFDRKMMQAMEGNDPHFSIAMFGKDGKTPRLEIGLDDSDDPIVKLNDERAMPRLQLRSGLRFFGLGGLLTPSTGTASAISLYSPDGIVLANIQSDDNTAAVRLNTVKPTPGGKYTADILKTHYIVPDQQGPNARP